MSEQQPTEYDVAAVMLALGYPLPWDLEDLHPLPQKRVLTLAQLIADARTATAPDTLA